MGGKAVIVAIAAIALVLPSVTATDYTCGPFKAKDEKCEHSLKKGDKVTVDCTESTTYVMPTTLLSGTTAGTKVCSETKARTAVVGACGSEVTLESLKAKNVAVTASKTGFTITNTDYKEDDMIIAGACSDNEKTPTKSGYFNITLKKPDSSTPSSAHGTRVGLAAATGVALLGLAAF